MLAPPPTLQHLEGVCGCSARKRDDFVLERFRDLADSSQSSTLPTPSQACQACSVWARLTSPSAQQHEPPLKKRTLTKEDAPTEQKIQS